MTGPVTEMASYGPHGPRRATAALPPGPVERGPVPIHDRVSGAGKHEGPGRTLRPKIRPSTGGPHAASGHAGGLPLHASRPSGNFAATCLRGSYAPACPRRRAGTSGGVRIAGSRSAIPCWTRAPHATAVGSTPMATIPVSRQAADGHTGFAGRTGPRWPGDLPGARCKRATAATRGRGASERYEHPAMGGRCELPSLPALAIRRGSLG